MYILNSDNFAITKETIAAIENHHTDMEMVGDVVISVSNDNTDDAPCYDVYTLNQNYLFSIDTDGDVIYEA